MLAEDTLQPCFTAGHSVTLLVAALLLLFVVVLVPLLWLRWQWHRRTEVVRQEEMERRNREQGGM